MENKLVEYFIEQTNQRLANIESKLDDLTKFKAEMLVSARVVGAVTGSLFGLISSVMIRWLVK